MLLLSSTAMFLEVGCAALERDGVVDGTVRFEDASSDTTSLSRDRIYQDNGAFVVYGKPARKAGLTGRVDAIVRGLLRLPDGRTVEKTKRAFPPYPPIRRNRHSNFAVRFRELPPIGLVVRIECPPIPASAPVSSSPVTFIQCKEIPK